MKTLTRLTLLVAGLAVATLPLLAAGDATAASPASTHRPGLRARLQHRLALRHRIAHQLNLTSDQTAQLKAERAKVRAAVRGIRADKNLTPEQKKTQVRDALKGARSEMRAVLSPEQQAKLRQLRARLQSRR